KDFEKAIFFEGCMPVEEMASRGVDTLRYGPLKPVGLEHPVTGEKPYAVVQLRQDNYAASLYNIVGFQTHLKWPEQKRVFGLIPGLDTAEFVRYGVMHRNTFINSPTVLKPTLQMQKNANILFAGQMTGVEGYIESAACGLVAGINAAKIASGQEPVIYPADTAHGAMCQYITNADAKKFQPMNVNFGLLPPLEERIKDKKIKNRTISERALASLESFKHNI
ncbi:MAG: Methylenetetrahydrofolate--tRNA-(uracil-5-)-methyltransferase trmFO, partial [Massilibacillus sp.]|nr:Methylenetetrahydrofolate--tRNA-(uracil-5-)-methyltransferase trmFO [Massilibacillus sp.]